ncbi:MAG TPA: PQQ-binding-like beta-propeller repeat protein [Pirellulaceae bacterium]|nr:PQQ-binding-like beta-propeller repeat protein [Pirellulaceae bacterium]HMO90965.1 PQQ-binding-like beta-propeller repeat protein [Pirellulaceae bacterium]HMP69863.1 PQQ-binding-like beta-propeller repeat protein [Pirellulaceae bacterium]
MIDFRVISINVFRCLCIVLLVLADGNSTFRNHSPANCQESKPTSKVTIPEIEILQPSDLIKIDEALARVSALGGEPTPNSIRRILQSLLPDDETAKQRAETVHRLIELLGDDDYRARDQAFEQLMAIPLVPIEVIEIWKSIDDLEVRYRLQALLDQIVERHKQESLTGLLEAVCVLIRVHRFPGFANELLKLVPIIEKEKQLDEDVFYEIQAAILQTATTEDAQLAIASLLSRNENQRRLGLGLLYQVEPETARHECRRLLNDKSLKVQYEAACKLAGDLDLEALLKMADLINCSDRTIRVDAELALRAMTGQHFGFVGASVPADIADVARQWKNWLTGPGETATLVPFGERTAPPLGKILIADYRNSFVTEHNMNGEVSWSIRVAHPLQVQGLSNGHRLVSTYKPAALIEFDEQGNEVWRVNSIPGNAMGVQRLSNGNTLVATGGYRHVMEYKPNGSIAWKRQFDSRVSDAKRLSNGNTLVTLFGARKIIEIDPKGAVTWELSIDGQPMSATRAPNGNTCVALLDPSRAQIFDANGTVVHQFETESPCTFVMQIFDEKYLVVCKGSYHVLSPEFKPTLEIHNFGELFGGYSY